MNLVAFTLAIIFGVILAGLMLLFFWVIYKQIYLRRIKKKIPDKIKKEVEHEQQNKTRIAQEFTDTINRAESLTNNSGGIGESKVSEPKPIGTERASPIKDSSEGSRRVSVPTSKGVSKSNRAVKLHRPADL